MKKSFYLILTLSLAAAGVSAAEKVLLHESFDSARLPAVRIDVSKDYPAKFSYFPKEGHKKAGCRGIVLPDEIIPGKSIGIYTLQQPLDPEKSYVCRIYIKPNKKCGSGTFVVTVRPRTEKGEWLWKAQPFVKKIDMTELPADKWTKVEFEFKALATDRFWKQGKFFIPIFSARGTSGLTLYIDDLEIIEK